MARSASSAAASRTALLVSAAVFAVSLAYLTLFLRYGINLDDEGTLLYQFARMAGGERPYQDFHAGYTPGVYYLHSWLQGMFGSILPGRLCLAVVNAASVAMLAGLVVPLAGAAAAAAAAATLLFLMPLHPVHFAVFNIPYPGWYAIAAFLAGLFPARAFLQRRSVGAALAAGACAGLGFLFKPNAGAFQLACTMLLVLSALPRTSLPGRAWQGAWWWAVWAAVVACLLAVFGLPPDGGDLVHLLLPALACAALTAYRAGTVPHGGDRRVVESTLAVAGGFVAVTLVWLAPLALQLPFADLMERVLFIGSDYVPFFQMRHPPAWLGAALLAAVYLGLIQAGSRLTGVGRARAALAALAACVLVALLLMTRPMVHGFAVSLMSAFESAWSYRIAIAVHWLLVAMMWMDPGGDGRRQAGPGQDGAQAATLSVVGFGASFLYLQIYPRTDFTHWVWAAPLSVAGAMFLLHRLTDVWTRDSPVLPRRIIVAVLWLPVALLTGLRAADALSTRPWSEAGTVQLQARRAPVRIGIGRAAQARDLNAVVATLQQAAAPDQSLFGFPVLDAILFLAEQPTPVRDSYFFPGWLGHDDEARLVATLHERPPGFAVVLREHRPFFDTAPAYYQLVARYLERWYRPYARVGRYDVLMYRGSAPPPPAPVESYEPDTIDPAVAALIATELEAAGEDGKEAALMRLAGEKIEGYDPALTQMLEDEDPEVRSAAVHALGNAADDRAAAALASAATSDRLAGRERTLALRLAGAWAGPRTVEVLAPLASSEDEELREAARNAMAGHAERHLKESFWLSPAKSEPFALGDDAKAQARAALHQADADVRLKTFAATFAAELGAVAAVLEAFTQRCAPAPSGEGSAAMDPQHPCLLPAQAVLGGLAPTPQMRAALLASIASVKEKQLDARGRSLAYALALRLAAEDEIFGAAAAWKFLGSDRKALETLKRARELSVSPAQAAALDYLSKVHAERVSR